MADPVTRVEETLEELREAHERCRQVHEKLGERLEPMLELHRPPPVSCGAKAWTDELLEVARHDLRAAQALASESMDAHAPSVAMLLQMAFEKLAKAYMAHTDWPAFVAHRRSHAAATRFTQVLKRHRSLMPTLNRPSGNVLAQVEALTRVHPALAKNGPHLEYPWEQGEQVCSPTRDLAIVNELRDPRSPSAPQLMKLAAHFIEKFYDLFG